MNMDTPAAGMRPTSPWKLTPLKAGPPRPWLALLRRIDDEVTTLARYRETWRVVNDLAQTSSAINEQPYFVGWIAELYGSALALGVRKMVDDDPRAASLFMLLEKIAQRPQKLTRAWYCSGVYEGLVEMMDLGFTRDADPKGIGHIDPDVLHDDQKRLQDAASRVTHYVNQHVAHAQAKQNAPIPTFSDLNSAIDVLNDIFVKYTRLLTRGERVEIAPVFQFPWPRIFERAWTEEKP